ALGPDREAGAAGGVGRCPAAGGRERHPGLQADGRGRLGPRAHPRLRRDPDRDPGALPAGIRAVGAGPGPRPQAARPGPPRSDQPIRVWDVTADPPTFNTTGVPPSPTQGEMVFTPDGRRLVTQHDDGLRLWDVTGPAPRELWTGPLPMPLLWPPYGNRIGLAG